MILRIAVAGAAAIGVFSSLFFLSLTIGAGAAAPAIVSAIVCAALAWWARLPATTLPSKPPVVWLRVVFFVVLGGALIAFYLLAAKEPHGAWDAWSIWNMHARFLARGGAQWTTMFSPALNWTHPGYPMLLPAFIAQFWMLLGSQIILVPFLTAFLFTFGTAAALVASLRRFRGWDVALIAGAFLLGTTDFIVQGAAQYADVPLAFYILASIALLCMDDARCTVLAGLMAGFGAWTKNEGLLFVVVLIAARSFARWRSGKAAGIVREVGLLLAGAAPALAVLALFKFRYAPPDVILSGHKTTEILAHAADFGRYVTVIEALVKCTARFGELVVPAVLLLAAFAWLVRFKVAPEERLGLTTVIATVVLMLAGDLAVYLLIPNDLVGTIGSSIARLYMQIWPAGLLAFFWASSPVDLRAAPPVEKPAKNRETKKQVKKTAATRRR